MTHSSQYSFYDSMIRGFTVAFGSLSDCSKQTALISAIRKEDLTLVRILAPHNNNFVVENGKTPVMVALETWNTKVLEVLIDNYYHTGVTFANRDLPSPLMTAVKNGKIDCIKQLIRNGDVDYRSSSESLTPIMVAARDGATEIVKLLLPFTDPNVHSKNEGLTALSFAILYDNAACVEVLASKFKDDRQAAVRERLLRTNF